MKRIAYSFLLIAVLSCGSKSEFQENRIRVQFQDSTSHEYHLLAVRENTLVVGPGYYDPQGPPKLIPFANINRVYHAIDGKAKGAALGGLIGCGAAIGGVVIIAKHNGHDEGGLGYGLIGALIALPATLLGMEIGYSVTDDDREYDLSKSRDVSWLREFARYPNTEPPELQKLK